MAGSQSNGKKNQQGAATPGKARVKVTLNQPQSSGTMKPGKKYGRYFRSKQTSGSALKHHKLIKGKVNLKRIRIIGKVSAPEKPVDAPKLPDPFEQ